MSHAALFNHINLAILAVMLHISVMLLQRFVQCVQRSLAGNVNWVPLVALGDNPEVTRAIRIHPSGCFCITPANR